jgi:hypothetical protein
MKQSAAERPDPTLQRKAAIARGAALEHTGKVRVEPIPDFDLDRTIFKTLEGKAARFVVTTRVGKEARWDAAAARAVQAEYETARAAHPLPAVSPELMQFLVRECDFDVEHADGSFLDHLYFCFEYSVQHYPGRSPLVMLLHSILGTGTNTFAMPAEKIPELRKLMTPWEWTQTEAFPSVLRLLYAGPLRRELRENLHRSDAIASISLRRVIDNEPITMSGEDPLDRAELPAHPPGGFPAGGELVGAPERHLVHPVPRPVRPARAGRQAGGGRALHPDLAAAQDGGRAAGRGRLAHHADPGGCERADGGEVGHALFGAHRAFPRLSDRLEVIRAGRGAGSDRPTALADNPRSPLLAPCAHRRRRVSCPIFPCRR